MKSEDNLNKLSQQLSKTVERIETLQKGNSSSLSERLRGHLRKQGGLLTNVAFAGCVLVVALGRLQVKTELQVRNSEAVHIARG